MKKLFNTVNLLNTAAFIALLCTGGFAEGENLPGAALSLAVFAGAACLSLKEDGQIKK